MGGAELGEPMGIPTEPERLFDDTLKPPKRASTPYYADGRKVNENARSVLVED